MALSKIIYGSYLYVLASPNNYIEGPDLQINQTIYPSNDEARRQLLFIRDYLPTADTLLATYPFTGQAPPRRF